MPAIDAMPTHQCAGCGAALARPDSLLADTIRYVEGRDRYGSFVQCPECRGQNYYVVSEGQGLIFLAFQGVPSWLMPPRPSPIHHVFLRCFGAALAILGLAKFIPEVVSDTLLPYPPVALFTVFLAWAALYLISMVRSAPGSPSRNSRRRLSISVLSVMTRTS